MSVALLLIFGMWGCEKSPVTVLTEDATPAIQRANIGLADLIDLADVEVNVTPRSMGGYTAEARGRGTIPGGEYAGWKFHINISAHYSGVGNMTLESGSALVRLRGERFVSVMDPALQSFCCGEGDLVMDGEGWVFSMYGQVSHTTASPPHNHLFAAAATTAGSMNMTILDQSGTVVEQADPPHDPGIGEIFGFEAQNVDVIPD